MKTPPTLINGRHLTEAEARRVREVLNQSPAVNRAAGGPSTISEAEARDHAARLGSVFDSLPDGPATRTETVPSRSSGDARTSRPAGVEVRSPGQGQGQATGPRLPHQDPANTRNGRHAYSITRAIAAVTRGAALEGLEAEVHQELVRARGKRWSSQRNHFLAPSDMQIEARDLTASTGAGLIGSHRRMPWIEALRNRLVCAELGAEFLTGLKDTGAVPRVTTGATFGWLAPGAAPTEAAPEIGAETLTPRRARAFVDVDTTFLAQAGPGADSFVMLDLANAIAAGIDAAALAGGGTNQPVGVLSRAGVRSVAMGGAPTLAKLNEAVKLLGQTNGDRGSLAFVMSPAGREALANTERSAGSGRYLFDDQSATLAGFTARISTAIPSAAGSSSLVLGDFEDMIIGYYTDGIEMLVNPYSFDTAGIVRIVAAVTVAVLLRRPDESWIKLTGMTVAA